MSTPSGTAMETRRRISNSEAIAWLTCQKVYYYAFILKLEKIELLKRTALGVGNAVHDAFKVYYRCRIKGGTHDDALMEMDKFLTDLLAKRVTSDVNVMEAKVKTTLYFEHYGDEASNFRWIGSEEQLDLPLNDKYTMPLQYDLYYQDLRDGAYVLKDFKTCYDFWTADQIRLSPQFPKYFAAMRNSGLAVDRCELDLIRTRSMKNVEFSKHYYRVRVTPKAAKIRNVLKTHLQVSEAITAYRAMPPEIQKAVAMPVLNWHGACRMCTFKDLCATELEDGDIALMVETEYKKNTYDYNPEAHVPTTEGLL